MPAGGSSRRRPPAASRGASKEMPSGIEVLVLTWSPMLRRYSLALTGSVHDADDVVQETFLEAQGSLSRFERGSDFGAWLRGIARHVAARHRRDFSRRARLAVSLDPEVLDRLECLYQAEERADLDPVAALRRCLKGLSDDDSTLVRSRYEAGSSVESLARSAGRTLSWAKTRLMRIRAHLADCVLRRLSAEGGGEA